MGGAWENVGGKLEEHGSWRETNFYAVLLLSDKNDFKKLSAAPTTGCPIKLYYVVDAEWKGWRVENITMPQIVAVRLSRPRCDPLPSNIVSLLSLCSHTLARNGSGGLFLPLLKPYLGSLAASACHDSVLFRPFFSPVLVISFCLRRTHLTETITSLHSAVAMYELWGFQGKKVIATLRWPHKHDICNPNDLVFSLIVDRGFNQDLVSPGLHTPTSLLRARRCGRGREGKKNKERFRASEEIEKENLD